MIFLVPYGSPETEAVHAERKLERMELYEDIAEAWEREACSLLRQQFAESYRRLVGVLPEQRGEFRDAMLRILDGGGMPVEAVEDLLQRN